MNMAASRSPSRRSNNRTLPDAHRSKCVRSLDTDNPEVYQVTRKTRISALLPGLVSLVLLVLMPNPLMGGADVAVPLGVETIDAPLPTDAVLPTYVVPGGGWVLSAEDDLPIMQVWLSRNRYWQQDGHMAVVVRVKPPADVTLADSQLSARVVDEHGKEQLSLALSPLPGKQFAFYPKLPAGWTGKGAIELTWRAGERVIAEDRQPFRVERFKESADRTGRVRLDVRNAAGVWQTGVPMTVGLPFPRGALYDAAHLRLVDEAGNEVPLQARETGRWSKFGPIRWVLCDFTLDLRGEARTVYLIYGPDVTRSEREPIVVQKREGFPSIDLGRLRLDKGLWFDAAGDGRYVKVLDERALSGAYVEHEDGRTYRAPEADRYVIEEHGSEKVVVYREGWYRQEDGERKFCRYEIRYVIHRDSPLVRVFHTWVYTGDDKRDRIAEMGWQLPLADGFEAGGFLSQFGNAGRWLNGSYLLQDEYNAFELADGGQRRAFDDDRSAGVAKALGQGVRLYFGAKDFWQNFPSELGFADGSLWFHNWPRHGKPRPEPLVDVKTATLLRFAHTGRALDLMLPDAYTQTPLDESHNRRQSNETTWLTGKPESVNAQGLARTEEFWLYLTPDSADERNAERLLEALNDETLRPVVDTRWVANSGAFFEIHQQDWENDPDFERRYQTWAYYLMARTESVGLYGMWLYGEHLWDWDHLGALYRQLRKGHGGYGILSWMPYARSGDPIILKRLEASTRHMIDANFCHYASEQVTRVATGNGEIDRRRGGFWSRGPLPWGGPYLRYLDYETQPHQWWDAWYLTGYRRARDFAWMWSEHVKPFVLGRQQYAGNRHSDMALKASVDTYQNTFDPWFIVFSHALAQRHLLWAGKKPGWASPAVLWSTGDREYQRFNGQEDHAAFYVNFVDTFAHGFGIGQLTYAWVMTGDETFLRRIKGMVDTFTEIRSEENSARTDSSSSDYPMALYALEHAGKNVPGIYRPFFQRKREYERDADGRYVFHTPTVAIRKEAGQALPIFLGVIRLQTYQTEDDYHHFQIIGPDGQEVLSGNMSAEIKTIDDQPGREFVIPADAPAGVYRVHYEIRSIHPNSTGGYRELRGARMPMSPTGTPEVIVLDEDRMGPASVGAFDGAPAYFFFVPRGVTRFTVNGVYAKFGPKIRDPDGRVVWQAESGTYSAVIDVPSKHQGRLWRIVGSDFQMDPQIPPYYAIDPDRWFNPETTKP